MINQVARLEQFCVKIRNSQPKCKGIRPLYSLFGKNHGYEPQSKVWKQIPQQAAGLFPINLWLLDNSTTKFHYVALMKFESHYKLPIPLRFVFGIGVSTIKKLLNSKLTCVTGIGGRSDPSGMFE
jgi:hypothetical protein